MKPFLFLLTGLLSLRLAPLCAREKINQSLIVNGCIKSTSNLQALNPDKADASASFNCMDNTARIRLSDSETSTAGGLEIQTSGN
ncbi:hypothetical protein [Cyclobacterium plantarum]|uniref:hypothetical protein n=1 Tax=Cyclobacterium plantarum TaxID=2716263 RepID=UPI003F702988